MKKTIILSMAMAFATFVAFAQESAAPQTQMKPRGTVEERVKSQVDRMNAALQLTPAQYTKVTELIKNSITQRDAVKASGATGEEMKSKMKALKEQEQAQMKTILTPEQFEKLQSSRREHEGQKPE